VAGIVGAGGNAGAAAAGLLFTGALAWPTALFLLGALVTLTAFLAFAVRFGTEAETEAQVAFDAALRARQAA
jgi:NNP family nitrate/nitrite transporter-like MFS transporter